MNNKSLYFTILFLSGILFPMNLLAQTSEQIHLKDGSVLEGYVAEQNPGKYITIQSSKATIVVNSDSLQNQITEKVSLSTLSKEWQDWALDHNVCINTQDDKVLEMSTLEFKNTIYSNVFLLEKGSLMKFISLDPNTYSFGWGDMYRTVKQKRPQNLFSGLKEILVLTNGDKIKGQIIEQYPGKNLKIFTDDDEIMTLNFSQVEKIQTEKFNNKFDLWSQIPLLDKIQIRGEKEPLVGFISSRTLSKSLEFMKEDGTKRTIPLSKVIAYYKIPNDKFVAVYDKVLNVGDVLLNGTEAYFTKLEMQDNYLLLGEIVSLQVSVGDTIKLEGKFEDPNVPITLVKAHTESIADKDSKKKNDFKQWPVITYQDLVQSNISVPRTITPLGNTKISFVVETQGDYIIYIKGREEYIVINVI